MTTLYPETGGTPFRTRPDGTKVDLRGHRLDGGFSIAEPYVTAGGKLVLAATAPGGLKDRKYVVSGYPFYVVTVVRSEWTWIRGEPVKVPSLRLTVDKRTKSKEVAMREFRLRGGPGTFVLWKSPLGGYEVVARGRDIAPS